MDDQRGHFWRGDNNDSTGGLWYSANQVGGQLVPAFVFVQAPPYGYQNNLNYNLGIYAQDRWTISRLTLSGGLRFDFLNESTEPFTLGPHRWLPTRNVHYDAVKNVPNWKDIDPRVSFAYDVFGTGKTAVKASASRSVMQNSISLALANNPDFILLQPGVNKDTGRPTEIPVEAVRAMKAWVYQRPMYGARKVVLIDDAEQMSDAASNTVLKVLEEPPAYVHFLLVSSRSGQLLETITSRCQDIAFRMLDDSEMKQVLTGLKMDADDAQLVAAVAAGRPGTALRLVREKMLPVVAKSIAAFEKIQASGTTERVVFAKKVADDDRMQEIVSWWLAWTHARLNDARLPAAKQSALLAVATGLLDLYAAVSESKFNRRLAVEKFLLELPSGA